MIAGLLLAIGCALAGSVGVLLKTATESDHTNPKENANDLY